MKKLKIFLTYISSNRVWIITLACLDVFFIFLAWLANPDYFINYVALIIFVSFATLAIALFGLHQNIVILGCCLAVLPYLLGAVYLQKSHKQCPLWLSASAILIPSIVEKIAIYLFGAYLYNLSPINVLGVMEAIKSNASYTNFIKNQSAQNLINLSYLNWTYILCSIAISVLVILLLNQTKQKSNKG